MILDKSNPGAQPLYFLTQRSIVGPADDEHVSNTPGMQRRGEAGDERRTAATGRQQCLGAAHAVRTAGGENGARNHAAF